MITRGHGGRKPESQGGQKTGKLGSTRQRKRTNIQNQGKLKKPSRGMRKPTSPRVVGGMAKREATTEN